MRWIELFMEHEGLGCVAVDGRVYRGVLG